MIIEQLFLLLLENLLSFIKFVKVNLVVFGVEENVGFDITIELGVGGAVAD